MKGCMTRREKESAPLWSVHQNCSTDNVQITLLVAGSRMKSQAGNKGRSGHATPTSLLQVTDSVRYYRKDNFF